MRWRFPRMKRLSLEFYRRPAPPRWAGWLLLIVAFAFAGDLARTFLALNAEVAQKELRLGRLDRATDAGLVRVAAVAPSAEELRFAADAIRHLAMPWDRLFRALEGAQRGEVTLLSIEPDADAGSVLIQGNAQSYASALAYVSALAHEPDLERVRLVKYETARADPRRPLSFSVAASWRRTP